MANAIRDKINNGYQLLIFDTYAKLNELTHGRTDSVYYVKADESHNPAKPVSYTWSGTAWTLLSDVADDLKIFSDKTLFPVTGAVDSLYYNTSNNYVEEWVNSTTTYRFLCQASSVALQLISGVKVVYNHASSNADIKLNATYIVGFDTRSYLMLNNKKYYLSVSDITTFFKPVDGRNWVDIIGSYTPPAVPVVSKDNAKYMQVDMYDSKGVGRVDLAQDSLLFNGLSLVGFQNWVKNNVSGGTVDFTPVNNKIGDMSKIIEASIIDAIVNAKLSVLNNAKRNSPMAGLSLLGAMLDGREGQVINVLGDSTGNETTEWVYMLGQKIANAYPNYNVRYSLVNKTTYLYDNVINIQDDGNPRSYRFTGSGNIPQLDKEQVPLTSADLDVRIKLSLDHWAEGTNKTLISRYGNTDGSRCWRLGINTGNFLIFHWTEDGINDKTAGYVVSTSQFADGSTTWLRVTMDVDNGASGNTVTFYKSTDGLTWTSLGNKVTPNTTTIYSSATQKYEIGGYNSYSELITGNVYDVQIADGIDGVNVAPRLIDAWKQPTSATPAATLQGTPEIFIYNGSIQGYGNTEYADATLLRKLIVNAVCPIMFISLGHNDLNRQGYDLFNTWDTLISRIRSYSLNPMIVACTQNPRIAPALWGREQGIRRRMWMSYAQKNNIGVVDTYLAFLQSGLPLTSLVNTTDGIHPVLAGEQIWCDTVWKYLNVIS